MNDNRPAREKVLAEILSARVVIEEHFTKGLRSMLWANDVPRPVLDAIESFARPALDRLRSAEDTVIAFARELSPRELLLTSPPEGLVVDAFSAVLTSFGEQFTQVANTPDQMKLAANFNDFVTEITSAMRGREAEMGKESKAKDKNLERE
jgi:hypothetical protein